MTFNQIIANPPYGKTGVDIVNKIINEIPYEDISILGTSAMLSKHNESLALEYVYIEGKILEPETDCNWVQQLIILGHKGRCKIIPATSLRHNDKTLPMPNEIRIPYACVGGGQVNRSLEPLLTRNRATSFILSVSDEEYSWIKKHWDEMEYVERFWWMHDHGLYKRFEIE